MKCSKDKPDESVKVQWCGGLESYDEYSSASNGRCAAEHRSWITICIFVASKLADFGWYHIIEWIGSMSIASGWNVIQIIHWRHMFLEGSAACFYLICQWPSLILTTNSKWGNRVLLDICYFRSVNYGDCRRWGWFWIVVHWPDQIVSNSPDRLVLVRDD